MKAPDIPQDEIHRLFALYQYELLDTEHEEAFDEIADLAATICEAPIALVSLVDQSRQWFKARVGLAEQQTARSGSFCAHAILQPELFVIPDTHADERFADNPLVTGPPHIRFYAGAPMFTREGHGLGTLCVIDHVPRELTPAQEKSLLILRTHLLKLLDLRIKSRQLAETNRELDTFSYTVSHDLRAPLRAIDGFTEILREDYGPSMDQEGQLLLERITNAVKRTQQLTEDLLSLARLERSELEIAEVNLSQLVEEAILQMKNSDPERRVDVVIEPNQIVMGDARLLRVAVENLIDNAWKYTAKTESASIAFGCSYDEDKPVFYIADNGAGFEMAHADKLFQPFQRLHSIAEYPGTGIGLATVKRIIQRHGGTISARAYPGKGCSVYFTLPALQTTP